MEFLTQWYRKEIRLEQVSDTLAAWMNTNWGNGIPSLVFTRPKSDFTPFWPPRAVEVVAIADNAIELRFEICNGITDPWRETVQPSELSEIVRDFLRISDEDSIYITLGPNIDWWKRASR
jgi:hypothetical protein